MSLFSKKKEDTKAPKCACNCGCNSNESDKTQTSSTCCGEMVNGICCIKVLGAGCKSCHAMLGNTKSAVENMGLDIEVEYVTDMEKIMGYGVMSMPALVVNEQIVSMGKVLKSTEIETLLHKLGY